ncbi:thioredoxin fold domain-containing protein [Oscillospiraceae bacterium N12]|jgi:thioredoxin 1|uniref:Thioredoxin fold domain-containing protein n=1 Tax=Jilunia laotingensis TaxID=2763675 RepID=A0A926IQS5_9BACT|nr:thioredoxin family protein [Jilunia laotingensis]MBC8592993.1 thioredoxin fold domain-containing protein [Jilunia laotingensis]
MKVIDLSKESFVERVSEFQQYPEGWNFKGDKPCVVDFHAPWCVYCKALSPVLDQLAEEYDGKIDFYKVDVDQEPELESAFKIRMIPNLLFVPVNGTPYMELGTMGKPQLKSMLEDLLAGVRK